MSPWHESRRPTWPVYGGIGLIVLGLVTGYLLLTGVIGTADDDGRDAPTSDAEVILSIPTSEGPGGEDERPLLEVVSWGRASGQLAVLVRNESRLHLERVRVRITARDGADTVVLSTAGTARDVCCTILGLPPGQEYGLFAELDPGRVDIATVEVTPLHAETRRATRVERVRVSRARLHRYADDTVVTAALTARGRLSGYVAVQAVLIDRVGGVAQVISGRFYCFEAGRPRAIRLRLFHPVPDDLRLDRILAYPIPAGVPAHVPWECR